ncbi:MAG: hypothetical protein HYV33_00190 [Candidatus Kerfeldbacteria bacterium]|nr:hypothetical protein [Candidatus Kerfeldbacteria bacterium]
MGGYFDDWNSGDTDEYSNDEFQSVDPLESLPKRDQDIFFRLLDLIPDDKREFAMEYFYDHPAKIRSVVDYIKQDKTIKKAVVQEQNPAAMQQVLAAKQVSLDDMGGDDVVEQ